MSAEIPICPLCHTPRMPSGKGDAWFWGCQNYTACTAPTTMLLWCHRISTTGSRQRDVAACWSSLGRMTRERKYVPAVWSHHQRQGRNHRNQQVHTAEIGVQRGEAPFQPEGGGTHRTGSGAGRGRRSQEVAGRGPFGSTSSPEQSNRSSIPSGTGHGENVPHHETVGGELGASGQ